MKSTAPKNERETIIRLCEGKGGRSAQIWTKSWLFYSRLKKRGFTPAEEDEWSALFVIPRRCVAIRRAHPGGGIGVK